MGLFHADSRLEDVSKLIPSFDRLVSQGDEMTPEELVVAFTIAPILGRWRTIRELGDRLTRRELKVLPEPSLFWGAQSAVFSRIALQQQDDLKRCVGTA